MFSYGSRIHNQVYNDVKTINFNQKNILFIRKVFAVLMIQMILSASKMHKRIVRRWAKLG